MLSEAHRGVETDGTCVDRYQVVLHREYLCDAWGLLPRWLAS